MRKYIRIEDEEHSKKVQEKLFEIGCEWALSGKTVTNTFARVLVFDRTKYIRYGDQFWEPREDAVEVVLVETVSYEFKEANETILLNGKKYRKRDLEEALKNIKPLN